MFTPHCAHCRHPHPGESCIFCESDAQGGGYAPCIAGPAAGSVTISFEGNASPYGSAADRRRNGAVKNVEWKKIHDRTRRRPKAKGAPHWFPDPQADAPAPLGWTHTLLGS